jgi:hypothetical protein
MAGDARRAGATGAEQALPADPVGVGPAAGDAPGPIKWGGTGNFDGPFSQDITYRLLVTP